MFSELQPGPGMINWSRSSLNEAVVSGQRFAQPSRYVMCEEGKWE